MVKIARIPLFALALAAVAVSAAWGQSPPAPPARKPLDTVVVTGKRPPDQNLIRTVIAPFVRAHAARDRLSGLLLRQPPTGICPVTSGLSPAFNAFVTRRIVEVAKMVGAVVQPEVKCRPNVQVLFAIDPQGTVDALAGGAGEVMLGFHFVGERRGLVHVSRPIQAWYVTGTISDTGEENAQLIAPDGRASPGGSVDIDDPYGQTPYAGTGSKLHPRNSSQIVSVLIVADLNQLDGHEIGPVSDYIAMLALSQAQSLDTCGPLPSILDLMAADCQGRPAPQSLTDGDIAFMKALYAADITSTGDSGLFRVERSMAQGLGQASAEPSPASPGSR